VKQVAKKKAGTRKAARGRTKQTPAKRKTAPKKAAKRAPSRKAAAKRPAAPVLWNSEKTRAAAKAPLVFPQRAGASVKLAVLFEMARARTAVLAAIQGLLPDSAERPHAEGRWNTRQHVLHLAFCDETYVIDLEIVRGGATPARVNSTKEDDDRENAEALARMDHLSWDEAQRLLHTARLRLLEAVEAVGETESVWDEGHLFRRILRSAAVHDRHHADAIKRWRTESNA